MLSSLLRLLALRPLLGSAILGVPLLLVLAVGLLAIWAFKFVVTVVLPVAVVVLLLRWLMRRGRDARVASPPPAA